ncbi:MAG TPA: HlyD family efflux transporter periplasmic adaptor subunit [Lacipirellulaceae bacterium]|nr:HlyD family efflux transporter periplasmic adaptor subunit [Lacipirellulaceae bacterium]
MNSRQSIIAALILVGAATRAWAQTDNATAPVSDPVVTGLVKVADEIKLPGKEAGVLVQLAVQEGNIVRRGQVIGKIDDSQPQMQKKAALAAYQGAYNRATEDVEIRFAQAQALVAQADYEQMVKSNELAAKAIAETEVRGKKLEWDKAILGTEKSRHDQVIAKFEALNKQAELDAADLAIQRRVITAPFDGVVEEIKRHQDEWIQPGDTILTLLRMDTMHVEGAIEQSKYDPHEITNCAATVEVEMARGRKATFQGRIIKVSSVVGSDGVYNVRAEIANQQEHGNWLLRDGMRATMTIHLGTGATAATGVSRAR